VRLIAALLFLAFVAGCPNTQDKPAPPMTTVTWEQVRQEGYCGEPALVRARVPGGWLYQDRAGTAAPICFVPDPPTPEKPAAGRGESR